MPTPHYGQPRYRVIADELRTRIETGAIPPGALLPPESALMAEYRASRGTIRQAIGVLREARLVATEHGRGTYAALRSSENESGLLAGVGTVELIRVREVAADEDLAEAFEVEAGTALVERQSVQRVGSAVRLVKRTYRLRGDD
ncbi:GntR family transcriptional regulator [Micromonospora sp. CPCC 206060]|uniref:GntR family transcriptional regulator n=1 Tax=Micromonospora sp. CPCC 206060 TaxID=3122406 RepID=UPI002FF17D01